MPSAPINATIDLSASGSYYFNSDGFLGYSFDLNLSSSDATGTIEIYCQNTDPSTDTFTRPPKQTYTVALGQFSGGKTSQPIDSAFLTAAIYCVVYWNRSAGTGSLQIIGSQKVFF